MKMEWLQNDHRQYVEGAKDLNLAGSCTPPTMEWSHGGRAVQAELRSCVATLAVLLISIQRHETRVATIRCPINYHLEPWTNQLFIKMPSQCHAAPKNMPHSWNWDCKLSRYSLFIFSEGFVHFSSTPSVKKILCMSAPNQCGSCTTCISCLFRLLSCLPYSDDPHPGALLENLKEDISKFYQKAVV